MTELLLTTVLTCREAQMVATRVILNNTIPRTVAEEVVTEIQLIAPADCVLPRLNR